jgi:hypothetical protein
MPDLLQAAALLKEPLGLVSAYRPFLYAHQPIFHAARSA